MGQGRIRRIGSDTVQNYHIEATETYVEATPADTPSPWGSTAEVDAMDLPQSTPVSGLTQMIHLGCLITFDRFPDFFQGAQVKVIPTYPSPEQPFLELWTHDSVTALWTKRRHINFASPFEGIPTGQVKIFDLDLAIERANVDLVWVTAGPLASLTAMRFLTVHCFGRCAVPIVLTQVCSDNPDPDNPDEFACLPPFEWPPDPDIPPIPDPPPGLPPFPDLCDPAAVAGYRAALPDFFLVLFDAWLAEFREAVPTFCDDPTTTPPTPPPGPPEFPPIDLCDPEAVAAYKLILTPTQLAYFEELLSLIDLPALCSTTPPLVGQDDNPPDPPPEDACDYNLDHRFPRQAPTICLPTSTPALQVARNFFFFYNDRDKANFLANQALESAEIQAAVTGGAQLIVFGTPSSGAVGNRHSTHLNAVRFALTGVGYKQFVGVRSLWGGVERNGSGNYNTGYAGVGGQTYWPMGTLDEFGLPLGPSIAGSGFAASGWSFNEDVRLPGEAVAAGDGRGEFGRVIGAHASAPGYYVIERVWERLLCSPAPVGGGSVCTLFATGPVENTLELVVTGVSGLANNGFLGANLLCLAATKRYISQQHLFSHYVSIVVFNERGEFLTSPQGSASITASVSKTEGVAEPITGFVNASILRYETPDYLGACPPPCHPFCSHFNP